MGPHCLIITGMHRSGTSLLAQAFYRAGLFMGDNLMEPGPNNPEGYFEDKDIIDFHNQVLRYNGVDTWQSAVNLAHSMRIPPDANPNGLALIEGKFKGKPVWGWKDPRTSWFLHFWRKLIPNAKFVFVYRRPEEVVWSLLRREDFKGYSSSRVKRSLLALRHWTLTNQRILDFINSEGDASLLIQVPDDLENQEIRAKIVHVITKIWDLPLINLETLMVEAYKPRLLRNNVPASINVISKTSFPVRRMNSKFSQTKRRLLSRYSLGDGFGVDQNVNNRRIKSDKVVIVVTPSKDIYSETFIRAHLDCLPAKVITLYGYPLPNYTDNGEVLYVSSRFENRVQRILGRRLFNLTDFSLHTNAVKKFLGTSHADVVLAEYGHTAVAMMNICKEEKIPLIVHFHGQDAYHKVVLDDSGQRYPDLFKYAAAIVAVSRDMRNQLIRLGAPENKVVINPYGVDLELFKGGDPANAPKTFIAVGRFIDKKAPHLTLLAFKEVVNNHPDAKLVMIGDGPLLEACIQLVHAISIDHAVTFTGSRSHAEVAELMRNARVFIQHSIQTSDGDSEGTPVAVIEASATGLPVVATKHAGIQDVVIDGQTGLLIPEGDLLGMAKQMELLCREPSIAGKLGKAGRERVEQEYAIESSISGLWNIISKSIESPSGIQDSGNQQAN
ncbi:MAG: glycosyltransferase [Chloroflexota bacterium]|nr:MAG: glycosyltransferase [Chloroflexota bacterium]